VTLSSAEAAVGHRSGLSWPLLVAAGTFVVLLTRGAMLEDGDLYWHIVAGRWMLRHLAIPTVDLFSYTMPGAPWVAHEWLAEILYTAAYSFGGWSAVVGLAAAAFAAALAILTRYLLRYLEPLYALVLTSMAFSLAAPHLLARPHTLAAPLLVYWTIALLRAQESNRAPPLWVALLMALWANLHGSFVFGLLLGGVFSAEAVLAAVGSAARWHAARQWSGFLLAALLASMANPHGPYSLLFAYHLSQMKFISHISEWLPANFDRVRPFEIWLLIGAVALMTRGLRLPLVRLALLVGLVHMALQHRRHQDLLGLLGPAIVAESLGAQWFAARGAGRNAEGLDRLFGSLAPPATTVAFAMVLAILAATWTAAIRIDALRPPPITTPDAALAAVHAAYPGGSTPFPSRVLNSYEFAGYLIFEGIPPFIDGRGDMYGDEFFFSYENALSLKDLELLPKLLERYQVGWTLLRPGVPAVALLDRLPGWRRLYADDTAVVHVRDAGK